jgi:cellulose biosynthesis protein BcsQ
LRCSRLVPARLAGDLCSRSQSNLTAAFLDDEQFEALWPDTGPRSTIHGFIEPLMVGTGDVDTGAPSILIRDGLALLPGDLRLSAREDDLSDAWSKCLDEKAREFRVMSAFWRVLQGAAKRAGSHLILMDLGPNLGSINRAALVASHFVVIPVAPDLFSIQGLRNLGPTLRRWRTDWVKRRDMNPEKALDLPPGDMHPVGYVVMQHAVRLDRPVLAYGKWIRRIPSTYREAVLYETGEGDDVQADPRCLALMKHYRSLVPMAMEARKPVFLLRNADGAIGGHAGAVQEARQDFARLLDRILTATGLSFPDDDGRPSA